MTLIFRCVKEEVTLEDEEGELIRNAEGDGL